MAMAGKRFDAEVECLLKICSDANIQKQLNKAHICIVLRWAKITLLINKREICDDIKLNVCCITI